MRGKTSAMEQEDNLNIKKKKKIKSQQCPHQTALEITFIMPTSPPPL
jgi:hypothetical protein